MTHSTGYDGTLQLATQASKIFKLTFNFSRIYKVIFGESYLKYKTFFISVTKPLKRKRVQTIELDRKFKLTSPQTRDASI